MRYKHPFSLTTKNKNKIIVLNFLPFKDHNGEIISYLNTFIYSQYLDELSIKIYYSKVLFYITFLLIFIFGLIIIKNHKALEDEKNYIVSPEKTTFK